VAKFGFLFTDNKKDYRDRSFLATIRGIYKGSYEDLMIIARSLPKYSSLGLQG